MFNLIELVGKRDSRIFISSPSAIPFSCDNNLQKTSVALITNKRRLNGTLYRGFAISNSVSILFKNFFQFIPDFQQNQNNTGWYITGLTPDSEVQLEITALNDRETIASSLSVVQGNATAIEVLLPKIGLLKGDLQLTFNTVDGGCFFAIHEVLSRSLVLNLCHGKGVELGPGSNPNILASETTDVTYVEEKTATEWNHLYNKRGFEIPSELWSKYSIGTASALPVPDHSCDFIFSSHVFEHLANPLGHLQYWRTKLRDSGVVVAIVPDMYGCKDYVYPPSALEELIVELESGCFDVTRKHYDRFASCRPAFNSERAFLQKESIHAHFYSPFSMQSILKYVVEQGWYSSSKVMSSKNNKVFYFVLES